MTPDQILDRAADLLERDGWQRGEYGPRTLRGPRCVVGSLMAARGIDDYRPYDVAHSALKNEVGGGSLTIWNDEVVKDKRQVIRTLRRTARKLRGEKR